MIFYENLFSQPQPYLDNNQYHICGHDYSKTIVFITYLDNKWSYKRRKSDSISREIMNIYKNVMKKALTYS